MGVFSFCVFILILAPIVGIILAFDHRTRPFAFSLLLCLAPAAGIAAVIIWMIKLHRAWKVIQSLRLNDPTEAGMPTPGQAVGLLFVPVFNLYWMFVATVGLVRRVNRFLIVRKRNISQMSQSTPLALCISAIVLGWIPATGAFISSIYFPGYGPFQGGCLLCLIIGVPLGGLYAIEFIDQANRITNEIIAAESP